MDMMEKMRMDQDCLRDLILKRADLFGLSCESIKPIPDGVYDIDGYYKSTPRIMWILKEPYDDLDATGNPIGGGWILNDAFDNEDAWKNKTWQPIIYISHGIKNCRHWNDMDWIHDDKSMVDRLKEIAYINLSKMPNRTDSNDDFVFEEYKRYWKDIVNKQIEVYKPNVIICGNTYWMIRDYLGTEVLFKESVIHEGINVANLINTKDYKIIDTYHPNQKIKGLTRQLYVDTVIDLARK